MNAGTIDENIRAGSATFIVTCDAPLDAAGGNRPFLARMYPARIVKNLARYVNTQLQPFCTALRLNDSHFDQGHNARIDEVPYGCHVRLSFTFRRPPASARSDVVVDEGKAILSYDNKRG